jgi:hypothetical protein
MRGQQERTGPLFSFISTEERFPRPIPCGRCGGWRTRPSIGSIPLLPALPGGREALDPTGAAAVGPVAVAEGFCEAVGTAGLQPAVPLVYRPQPGRPRLASDDIHQESRSAAQRGADGSVPGVLMASPEVKPLLSSEHFSVDGTLLRAWATQSSLECMDAYGFALATLDDDTTMHHRGGRASSRGSEEGMPRAKIPEVQAEQAHKLLGARAAGINNYTAKRKQNSPCPKP